MPAQKQRYTIRDVAAKAQVSISTVSRYLNQSGYVDPGTARRIAKTIHQIDYTPSIAASSLKSQKSRIVLLVVPDICNPFYSDMAKNVQALLSQRGYVMALFDSFESQNELMAITLAKQMYASGILLGSININPEVISALQNTNISVVCLNAYEQYPFDTVHVQGTEGMYIATQHLLSLGHQKIGFAGGTPHTMIEKSRRAGYERALGEAGLVLQPENIVEIGFSQSDGYEAGLYFATKADLPTAICCANDQIALGLLSAMNEKGIHVPSRVSVTGMDNIPYAQTSNPGLTSITNDSRKFSEEGVRLLFDRIDRLYNGPPREVAISHELILRGSSASPFR